MALKNLETSTVLMWYFIIRGRGRFCSTVGRSFESILHSNMRCLAVCSAFSRQVQSGVGTFSILWRYERAKAAVVCWELCEEVIWPEGKGQSVEDGGNKCFGTGCFYRVYTGCNRRNGPDFGRVFLMLNYTENPQNTYIQSSMVTEI